VYVRQSTQSQVTTNLESKRRQYDLVDVARQRGFVDLEIIDDDLGRSASGTEARPGFDRLVAWLCAGKIGAVLCFDASRLARNGRDWHHLLELCGLVEANRTTDPNAIGKLMLKLGWGCDKADVRSSHCLRFLVRFWKWWRYGECLCQYGEW
jgi:Resolvase, N terminal domain